jgi:hypothetical protein
MAAWRRLTRHSLPGLVALLWLALPGLPTSTALARATADAVGAAFQAHRSGITLVAEGVVYRILADDRDGSRHQRFLIRTDSGTSLLVSHNIDIAPRLLALRPGERLKLRGEYVWNPQGGLLHWTHHDPSGRHAAGYIERAGNRYD